MARSLQLGLARMQTELKKEMAKDYNEARKPMIERLRSFDQQLYQLDFIEQHQDECLPLVELLRDFVADFAQAYLERKKVENAFEFGDISHFAIEILETFPEVRRFYQERYHEVMVDEYQDTNHTQERMLDLLPEGKIALWWVISSSLSIVSVKRIRRFSVISLRPIKRIAVRAS